MSGRRSASLHNPPVQARIPVRLAGALLLAIALLAPASASAGQRWPWQGQSARLEELRARVRVWPDRSWLQAEVEVEATAVEGPRVAFMFWTRRDRPGAFRIPALPPALWQAIYGKGSFCLG